MFRIRASRAAGVFFAIVFAFGLAILTATGPSAHADPPAPAGTQERTLPLCEKGVTNPDGSKRTYQDYALCMAAQMNEAIEKYQAGNYPEAVKDINSAYFDWYENNLEPASMTLAGNRKVKMEGRFTRVKLAIRNNPTDPSIPDKLELIKTAVARDAMVLDGVLPDTSKEEEGRALLTEEKKAPTDTSHLKIVDLTTSFTLLLREGLEALLVVTAIILYLVKSGNKHLCKAVYLGVLAGVVLSFVLAYVMQALVGGAGVASELTEGLTMFVAVAMLFYVSNWMLGKTAGQNWSNYIEGMVKASVSSGAAKALVFAAFLAVIREGAELVLFYTASFADGGHNPLWIGLGFGLGVIALAVIFVVFRYGGAKLPVRPIFMATSILLFIMCISFVGKGVHELKEAGVILGTTNLPWVHYYVPDLGIFPEAETMLPQLILLIAAVWIIWHHTAAEKKAARVRAADKSPAATVPTPRAATTPHNRVKAEASPANTTAGDPPA